ncbi:MAG: hypothetical protein V1847_00920, partial [Candidatus Diapherotrites archaeon]
MRFVLLAIAILAVSGMVLADSGRSADVNIFPSQSADNILVPFTLHVAYVGTPGGSNLKDFLFSIADVNSGIVKYIVDENSISEPSGWSHFLSYDANHRISQIEWKAEHGNPGLAVGEDVDFNYTALTPSAGTSVQWSWRMRLQDNSGSSSFVWNGTSTTGPQFPKLAEVSSTVSPNSVQRGSDASFSIGVQNIGGASVLLGTGSTLSFSDDANHSYAANLSAPVFVLAGGG